jgi:predicted Zn-dependent protease
MLRRGFVTLFMRTAALGLSSLLAFAPLAASAEDQEVAIGKAEAAKLAKKGEVIESSPYYETLRPIAHRIAVIADPQYAYPFHFILVHEKQPNAFAVPGGSVYVTDSLMTFVTNKEELAAVLCHETSHDIHHDVVHNLNKTRTLTYAATALSMLIGGGIAGGLIGVAADVQSLHYSREVETQADTKGAETCAAAGFNPWGMVWLLERFSKTGKGMNMEVLSDHPTDTHRIASLRAILAADPARYGRFSPDITNATPLSLPATAQHARPTRHAAPPGGATPGPVEDEPTF